MRLFPYLILLLLLLLALLVFPPSDASSSVFYVSLAFLSLALFFSSNKRDFRIRLSSLGLYPKKRKLPALFLWGIATFLACVILTIGISFILVLAGVLDSGLVRQKVSALPLAGLIVAFTLAPLGEEAFFRGLLFSRLSSLASDAKKYGWLLAALLSSLLFSLMHLSYGSVAELAVAFFVGFALCAVTRKTGSLVPAVIAHSLFNFSSILIMVLFP